MFVLIRCSHFLLLLLLAFAQPMAAAQPAPVVLYTDITSGPNTGGENNKGIYLSVFGKNFGATGLGSRVKVFINDVEVDNYRYLGPSRGREDIQQITVQVGTLGSPALRVPLPIKVTAGALASNVDQTFTVNPGTIYFVDPVSGVDNASSTTGGGFADPFKSAQKPAGLSLSFGITSAATGGAWGRLRAGDFMVLRGGTYKDIGFAGGNPAGEGYFLQALNKSGCPIGTNCAQGGGTSSGPITIMGYPGETAFIDRTNTRGNNNFGGGISSADSARQALGYGAWFTLSNLTIEAGFTDGPINIQRAELNPLGAHWRIVNNELTGRSCATSTLCRAGAIAGSGIGNIWLGNYGHDIYDVPDANTSLENHGIYIGGGGSYEIAYNVLANIYGGNGIQVQSFNQTLTLLRIHHNVIRNVGKYGLNLTEGTGTDVAIWNNVIADVDEAGVRFKDADTRNLKLYNNTFYNVGRSGNGVSGAAFTNDTFAPVPAAVMFDVRNNIIWANAQAGYNTGCCVNGDFGGGAATFSNNLWFGAGAAPSFDVNPKSGNPKFVVTGSNFRLAAGSPAIDAGSGVVASIVTDDFQLATSSLVRTLRPQGAGYDIGAYEKFTGQCALDLDGDGRVTAALDGLMMARIATDRTGASVTGGITFPAIATRTSWPDIQNYLSDSSLDIDGDGSVTANDTLIILRTLLGFSGNAVTDGVSFATAATRKTWPDIRDYLVGDCGLAFAR
jgi:hypothetical protein